MLGIVGKIILRCWSRLCKMPALCKTEFWAKFESVWPCPRGSCKM